MTATDVTVPPATYSISSGADGGVWLGFGMGRVASLGVGLLTSILMMTAGAPIWLAVLPALVAVLVAAARIADRPALEWVLPLLRHRGETATGSSCWRAPLPPLNSSRPADGVRLSVPAEFGRPRVITCPDDPGIGMVIDADARTVTVTFAVCGVDQFPLLDGPDRDTLVAGWGDALAVLADTDDALVRLQLIERSEPPPSTAEPAEFTGENTPDWEEQLAAFATRHDTKITVQWAFPHLDAAALASIGTRCLLVSRSLLSARLLARPLSAPEVIRDVTATLTGTLVPAMSSSSGSVSRRTEWTHVRVDDRVHRAFAISGWPTGPVGASWLSPLLLAAPAGVTRTVSLHLERVLPTTAARVARTRRAKATLDQADRVRFGLASSAAVDNAQASGVAMDAELAAGYRTHRLTGLVTVSGDCVSDLDSAGRILRQAAAGCRLELRPLHGQHDVALAATAGLCRLRPRGHA